MKSFSFYLAGACLGFILAVPFIFELPGFVPPVVVFAGIAALLVAVALPHPLASGGFLYAAAIRLQKEESRLLHKRIKALRSVIEFYGSRSFYTTGAARRDLGAVARRALQYDAEGRTSSTALKLPNGED